MKKQYLLAGLGLVGLLSGYLYFRNKSIGSTAHVVSPRQLLENSGRQDYITPPATKKNRPDPIVKEQFIDDYTNHLNFLLDTPDYNLVFFNANPDLHNLKSDCDEEEIRDKHRELSEVLARRKIAVRAADVRVTSEIHSLFDLIDELVDLDRKLANCKYSGTQKWNDFLHEIAEHYALVEAFDDAGRACLAAGDKQCARDFFAQWTYSTEGAIAYTMAEELPALRDSYLKRGDLLSAGKAEWVMGNKERAKELMRQSGEFRRELELAKSAIADQRYEPAFHCLWNKLKIPFYRELVEELCPNQHCRIQLLSYKLEEF